MLICLITGDVNFDHLAKKVSARFLPLVAISPLRLSILWRRDSSDYRLGTRVAMVCPSRRAFHGGRNSL